MLGGSKISDKLGVVEALLDVVDSLVIGGAMCFTFLAAQGHPIGDSLWEPDQVDTCRRLLATAARRSISPKTSSGVDAAGNYATFGINLPDGRQGLRHRARYGGGVQRRHHGRPHGVLERPDGHVRRRAVRQRHPTVAQAMADTKAFTVVGGGDSAAALAQFRLDDEVDHVSTGGGASLELIELGDLPGLAALREAPNA